MGISSLNALIGMMFAERERERETNSIFTKQIFHLTPSVVDFFIVSAHYPIIHSSTKIMTPMV